jgi:diphosphomevalonate decarboxylase
VNSSQQVTSEAFSNIAFIKYWGKYGRQFPLNPSLSMPIPQCKSFCTMNFILDDKSGGIESFTFEGSENNLFKDRIEKYLNSIVDIYPLANRLKLEISTSNNFPHSAGIASSASSFAAIAKCLVKIEEIINGPVDNFLNRASLLARLASGSACRSLSEAEFTIWGDGQLDIGCNEFTQDITLSAAQKDKLGWPLLDSILVISSETKKVSSSYGHELMNSHPYKDARVQQANDNLRVLYGALENGDLKTFGEIIENEAMSLHALMLSSYPSFCLLHPNTLKIINLIKNYRKETDANLYYTIDAGPNIHLIYPALEKNEIEQFIHNKLESSCESIIYGESLGT